MGIESKHEAQTRSVNSFIESSILKEDMFTFKITEEVIFEFNEISIPISIMEV